MDKCPVCKEFRFQSFRHKCPPLWHVHLIEYDEEGEAKKVYASSASEAAQKRAEQYDSGDYPIAGNGEASAVVWDKDMENPVRYEIEARSEPVYYATVSREPIPDGVLKLNDEK